MGSRRGGAGIPHSWEKTSVRAAKQAGRLNVNLSLLLCYISFCLEKHEVIQKNIYSLNKGGGVHSGSLQSKAGWGRTVHPNGSWIEACWDFGLWASIKMKCLRLVGRESGI